MKRTITISLLFIKCINWRAVPLIPVNRQNEMLRI